MGPPRFRNDDRTGGIDIGHEGVLIVDPSLGAELSRNFSVCIEDYTECMAGGFGHELCKKAFDKCSIGILLESQVDSIQGCLQ